MSELIRRLFAGIWFGLAAIIPVAYFLMRDPFNNGELPVFNRSLILTAVIPIFISGFCGFGLGAQIIDPEEKISALQSIGRGLIIAFLSYLVLFTGSVVVLLPNSQDFVGIIVAGVIFFFYGLIFLGWLIALSGAAAGGLLYLFGLKIFNRNCAAEKFPDVSI